MTKMKTTISAITTAICVLGVLCVLGCSNNTVGTHTDPRAEKFLNRFLDKHPLILGPGEAWVEVGTENRGFIFHEDATFDYIEKNTDGAWVVTHQGKWSVNGVVLGATYSYRIDGSVLRLENSVANTETIILAKSAAYI